MDDLLQQTVQQSVGLQLRERRLELEFSLADLAKKTCIRRAYLEALERDAFEDLPGDAYRSGFLRNYAEALGLNSDRILRQWREQAGEGDRGRTDTFCAPGQALPRTRRSIGLKIVFMLALTAAALYFLTGRPARTGADHPPITVSLPRPVSHTLPNVPESAGQTPTVAGSVGMPETMGLLSSDQTRQNSAPAGGLAPVARIPEEPEANR